MSHFTSRTKIVEINVAIYLQKVIIVVINGTGNGNGNGFTVHDAHTVSWRLVIFWGGI